MLIKYNSGMVASTDETIIMSDAVDSLMLNKKIAVHDLDLSQCELRNVNFNGRDLFKTSFKCSTLSDCALESGSMIECDMFGSAFRESSFDDNELDGADLRYATFDACKFGKSTFSGAKINSGTKFLNCDYRMYSVDGVRTVFGNVTQGRYYVMVQDMCIPWQIYMDRQYNKMTQVRQFIREVL